MQYKLTDEQIEELIFSYEVSIRMLKKLEVGLNETQLVKDEEDYFLICCDCCAQYISVKQICEKESGRDRKNKFMNLSEIIIQQLGFFYNNFLYDKLENKIKYIKLLKSK